MSQQQSLADQVQWCIETQDYLNDLNQELKQVSEKYQNSIDELKRFGYLAEMIPKLESLCSDFQGGIDAVVDYIESEHIAYVDARVHTISNTISGV